MAQIVKLRRSSVSGQKPTNSNLQLGELALNTADGRSLWPYQVREVPQYKN
jgi:hypothetical protein